MNNISIAGNVSQDAEVRYLNDGTQVASFSVADNQGRDKNAIFWRCSLFGKRAESLSGYLKKGQPVTVSGNLTENEWTDKDGQKRKNMELRVADVALQGGQRQESAPAPAQRAKPAPKPAPQVDDFDDCVPF